MRIWPGNRDLRAPIAASLTGENGWEPSTAAIASWQPHYRGFAWELQQTFHKDGREIGVYIAYYRDQAKGRELVTSGNQLTTMEDDRVETDGTRCGYDRLGG